MWKLGTHEIRGSVRPAVGCSLECRVRIGANQSGTSLDEGESLLDEGESLFPVGRTHLCRLRSIGGVFPRLDLRSGSTRWIEGRCPPLRTSLLGRLDERPPEHFGRLALPSVGRVPVQAECERRVGVPKHLGSVPWVDAGGEHLRCGKVTERV